MLKIHETFTAAGAQSFVHLIFVNGELAVALDGEIVVVGTRALEAAMGRFGGPLEPTEPLREIGTMSLGPGRAVRHVRHLARYDVIARDFLVYDVAGRDSLCALAITVSAALVHLGRAASKGGKGRPDGP